jgi:hypothetical protein
MVMRMLVLVINLIVIFELGPLIHGVGFEYYWLATSIKLRFQEGICDILLLEVLKSQVYVEKIDYMVKKSWKRTINHFLCQIITFIDTPLANFPEIVITYK